MMTLAEIDQRIEQIRERMVKTTSDKWYYDDIQFLLDEIARLKRRNELMRDMFD